MKRTSLRSSRIAVTFLTLCIALLHVPAAWGHAVLVRSTPQANAAVSGPSLTIELTFNSRLDASHSSLMLLLPTGTTQPLEIEKKSGPSVLRSMADVHAKGGYRIRWQALSTDGHITRGEIPFQVK
jgi:methionine-rich copper-binding protein CopC